MHYPIQFGNVRNDWIYFFFFIFFWFLAFSNPNCRCVSDCVFCFLCFAFFFWWSVTGNVIHSIYKVGEVLFVFSFHFLIHCRALTRFSFTFFFSSFAFWTSYSKSIEIVDLIFGFGIQCVEFNSVFFYSRMESRRGVFNSLILGH